MIDGWAGANVPAEHTISILPLTAGGYERGSLSRSLGHSSPAETVPRTVVDARYDSSEVTGRTSHRAPPVARRTFSSPLRMHRIWRTGLQGTEERADGEQGYPGK